MRIVITIDEDSNIEDLRYDSRPASGMKATAMRDDRGDYIEVIIGRDHPLFNFKLIYDTCGFYDQIMFKKDLNKFDQFFIDLQDVIIKLIWELQQYM